MRTAKLSAITISSDRIRQTFNETNIEDLATSIFRQGLFHGITVQDDLTLVAGENRIKALDLLYSCGLTITYDNQPVPFGEVPYYFLKESSDSYEAELEENIKRTNLTWKEEATAIAKLHKHRTDQHGESKAPRDEGWTLTDTANEISRRRDNRDANNNEKSKIRQALIIADHIDDPFVAAAKDEKEAMRAIREKVKHEKRQKLQQEFVAKKAEQEDDIDIDLDFAEETNVTSNQGHALIRGDFFVEAPKLPANTFDVVLTDPPYGINIHKQKLWDGGKHDYDDSDEYFSKLITVLAEQSYRVLKEQGHVYVFCDITQFNRLFAEFEVAGFRVWPRPLIWNKGNTGSFPDPDHGPRKCYDAILYAIKGEKCTTTVYPDVISIAQPSIGSGHPASKPVDLYADLLKRSVYPGDKVVDFFAGSGPIFPAADKMSVTATGIELEEKYYLMAFERLTQV